MRAIVMRHVTGVVAMFRHFKHTVKFIVAVESNLGLVRHATDLARA